MRKHIRPASIEGAISAPPSKSIAQRLIAGALLCDAPVSIANMHPMCADAAAAIAAVRLLGASVVEAQDAAVITSRFLKHPPSEPLAVHCGESGLFARTIAPIAALSGAHVAIAGSGSLRNRSMAALIDALRRFGLKVGSNGGCLPLAIEGQIRGGTACIDGSGGSQTLTGLLTALPCASNDSTLHVSNLQSKPYIDITMDVLRQFGIAVEHTEYRTFHIKGRQHYRGLAASVESDWSAASCLLAAGCIAGKVAVDGLNTHSLQADAAIMQAIEAAGGKLDIKDGAGGSIVAAEQSMLHAFDFDASHCPDLFPALAALAANCSSGISRIYGANRLVNKESNRAAVLAEELGGIGVNISINGDVMSIKGGRVLGGSASAHNDHRIAMCLAAIALNSQRGVEIDGAECVAKSYPSFWGDLEGIMR